MQKRHIFHLNPPPKMVDFRHATCSLPTVGDAVGSPLGCPRIAHLQEFKAEKTREKTTALPNFAQYTL